MSAALHTSMLPIAAGVLVGDASTLHCSVLHFNTLHNELTRFDAGGRLSDGMGGARVDHQLAFASLKHTRLVFGTAFRLTDGVDTQFLPFVTVHFIQKRMAVVYGSIVGGVLEASWRGIEYQKRMVPVVQIQKND